MTKNPTITVSQPRTLFTKDGITYYLVTIEREDGKFIITSNQMKDALEAGGHVPAVIRDEAILTCDEMRPVEEFITLFDCRPDMMGKTFAVLIPERHRTIFPEKYTLDNISDKDRRIDLKTSKGLIIWGWGQLDNSNHPRHPVLCSKKAD